MTSSILVTGASGQLGGYLLRELRRRGAAVTAWSGSRRGELFGYEWLPVDLADRELVTASFHQACPAVVIHAGAFSRIDQCHADPAAATRVNEQGTALLAELCEATGTRLVYVSTDLVFDGQRGGYCEDDAPAPLSVYGRTKAAAERAVLGRRRAVVVRISLMFGPSLVGRAAFFDGQLRALRDRVPLRLFSDEWRTPLSLQTAALGLLAVAESDFDGLLHFGGPERMTRLEMGLRLATLLGADPGLIVAVRQADAPLPEPRPRDVSLNSQRFRQIFPRSPWPDWETALTEMGLRR